MPRFSYKARDAAGTTAEAVIEAPSRKDALRLLSARGLSVLSVSEPSGAAGAATPGAAKKPAAAAAESESAATQGSPETTPKRAQRLPFLESLHDLTSSGLSAGEAVRLLSIRIKEPRLRSLCEGLWGRLSEGAPLSRAMEAFPEVFDSSTVNLVKAGEATGSLNDTLARLIEMLTEQRELRAALLTALAYPIVIVLASFGVVLFFLLPRLQTLLASLGGKMPLPTRILISLANFTLHYGIFVALALAIAGVSFWRWRSTEPGRVRSDHWLLKLPAIGPFIVSQTVLSFSQTLGVLLQNGITAADALRMTERQIDNRVHRQAFQGAIERVLEGESLSSALARTGCFPELVLDRLSVGENTGNVVPSLRDIAKTYQKQISRQLNFFTKVIASAILGAVFIFVGFIAIAMVMAVLQVSSSFKVGG